MSAPLALLLSLGVAVLFSLALDAVCLTVAGWVSRREEERRGH